MRISLVQYHSRATPCIEVIKMKLIIVASLLSIAIAEKLNNVYLPPSNAKTAGGSGSFLLTPIQAKYQGPQLNYQTNPNYQRPIQITRYVSQNDGEGNYQFDYETENGISQHEVGRLNNARSNQESSVVRGSYAYTAPNGQVFTLEYVADENGFQPTGSHLPVPPPIPDDILKSLQQNAADEAAGIHDDGQYRPQYDKPYNQNNGYQY